MNSRADALTELLRSAGVDVLLVNDLVNVRYLTGYTGSNGLALLGDGSRGFITDFRYLEQAAEQVDPSFERRIAPQELLEAIADALPDGELRLGFEEAHLSVRGYKRLREELAESVELVGTEGLVEGLRAVKEPQEIARIRQATELAEVAFEQVVGRGLAGRTERDVALALEVEMRKRGALGPSFDTIVATGPQGALPHARPRDVEIKHGEMVVLDWGAELDGYCSDCTRTLAAGEPGQEASDVYGLVLEAQLAGLEAVRGGTSGREVDGVARAIIEEAGHGERFGHGLGHGVGLVVHEGPRLSQRTEDVLSAGNVVTVEPGVYLPGRFGVRIEDLVVVTEDGCDVLTSLPKELTITD
jgi:Xaa-Pro aminopeptidase